MVVAIVLGAIMYVVTGGAGFIGSVILSALELHGYGPLVVVDRLRHENKWRNIAKRELSDVVHPDHMFNFLEKNKGNIKAIIHMAAISTTTETDVDYILKNNYNLSLELFSWCTLNNVRIIYASSAATYGDGSNGFDDCSDPEYLANLHPLNAYGWSKHLFDRRIARKKIDNEPMPPQWVGLKFFNVYGPNEYHKSSQRSVIVQMVEQILGDGGISRLFRSYWAGVPDGCQKRDFVWVNDVSDVIVWLLDHPEVNGLFNLGSGNARSFLDLVNEVYKSLGRKPMIEFIDMPRALRERYQYFTEAKMSRLRQAGYSKPFTTLEDGVGVYVKQFLTGKDQYL